MNTLTPDEFDELMDRGDMTVFPSTYAISAYEAQLVYTAYDLMVQAFYNL